MQCNESCVYHDVQMYYLRASSEVERQRWVTALTLAKAKAVKDLESGINTHQNLPLCIVHAVNRLA